MSLRISCIKNESSVFLVSVMTTKKVGSNNMALKQFVAIYLILISLKVCPIMLWAEQMFEYGSLKYGTLVTLIRLNYSVELRYGVLVFAASKV